MPTWGTTESQLFLPGSQRMTTPPTHPTISLLVVRDCPNEAPAAETLREALALVGHPGHFSTVVVEDHDRAGLLGFTGSPSFHLEGRDLLPTGQPPSLACRLYPGVLGRLQGVPTVLDLTRALLAADPAARGQLVGDRGARL